MRVLPPNRVRAFVGERRAATVAAAALALASCWAVAAADQPPLRLHPENPRYFLWSGRPTVLVTAGEHYGAVLNLDFNYIAYLDELARHRFNLTRIFSGTYREVPGSFNITSNTLLSDYQRTPVKPCGLGEGPYEDGPQYPTKPINALVIRKQACWSWFAGGYHTYGNGNVWHFDTCKSELTQTWKEALRSPGAATLRHAKNFLTQIGWWKFVPDALIIAEGEGSGRTRNVAMRSVDGDALAVYFASPAPVKLRLEKLTIGDRLTARWTNPATGVEPPDRVLDRQAASLTPPAGWSDALLHVTAPRPSLPK